MSAKVGSTMTAELDKRFKGVYDHADTQVSRSMALHNAVVKMYATPLRTT